MTDRVEPLTSEEIDELAEHATCEQCDQVREHYPLLLAIARDHARLVNENTRMRCLLDPDEVSGNMTHTDYLQQTARELLAERDALRAQLDEAKETIRRIADSDADERCQDPGWYWYDTEYPDEGLNGPHDSEEAARADGLEMGMDAEHVGVLYFTPQPTRAALSAQLDEAKREVELWKSAAMRETAKTTEFADARDRHLDAANAEIARLRSALEWIRDASARPYCACGLVTGTGAIRSYALAALTDEGK